MVVPATGMLDDFGDRPMGMPFDVFSWCLAACLVGTRIVLVSVVLRRLDTTSADG
ncbi:hypothetical protein [Mesorhizobium sp. M0768]|uniref:hypothetical protein n=1 Tax=unclassified Mesorhizobium TaxID=325217 RepID=UPI00333A4231